MSRLEPCALADVAERPQTRQSEPPTTPPAPMLRRATLAEFVVAPVGRYVIGRTFARVCFSPEVFCSIVIGRPDAADMRDLGYAHQAEIQQGVPHQSLFEASQLEAVTAAAYEALDSAWLARQAALNLLVRRQAIVHPAGMAGAVLLGYRRFSPLTFPTRAFAAALPALVWLGYPEQMAALHAVAAELSTGGAALRALRAHLLAFPDSTLAGASRALCVSERSLQRRLQIVGSTFRSEVARARVEAAMVLLADSDLKLTSIALAVGCASSQNFSALFHRVTGSTPSAWRARVRRGSGTPH